MVTDKNTTVTVRNKAGQTQVIEMTITSEQIVETIKRRMKTLMPTAQVIDITETVPDAVQLPLERKKQ